MMKLKASLIGIYIMMTLKDLDRQLCKINDLKV